MSSSGYLKLKQNRHLVCDDIDTEEGIYSRGLRGKIIMMAHIDQRALVSS